MSNFDTGPDCWYREVCTNECNGSCIRYLEMSYLMDHSNIPKNLQTPKKLIPDSCDFDTFTKLAEIKSNITEFVKDGRSLYICGRTTGNGKTSWAIKILLKYFDSVWPGNGFRTRGVFVHVPTFLLKCKDFNNKDPEFEELKQSILTADLVVWDDIASTNISAYDYSQLIMCLDARFSSGLSNIYTGNIIDKENLTSALGAKLTSRILSADTVMAIFLGGDRR